MSGYRRYRRKPRPSTRALTAKFAVLAVLVSLVIGGLLAAQMAAGNDPELGPKAAARAKKTSVISPASGYASGSSSSEPSPYAYPSQQSTPAPVTSSTS